MITILLTTQALAVILLGVVGLFRCLQKPSGGLNLRGYLLLGLGAVLFVASTVSIQAVNDAESDRKQRRIEELIDRYFSITSEIVMRTPKLPSTPPPVATEQAITITSPPEGLEVDQRHFVEGTVSDPTKEVWVVVHPLDTSSYWVQPRVSVRSNGDWRSMAYFGRSGDLDKGKRFEIVAISEPHDTLVEGEYGSNWPQAKWTSKPITVIRR